MKVPGACRQGHLGQYWSRHTPLTVVGPVWAPMAKRRRGGGKENEKGKAGSVDFKGGSGSLLSPPLAPAKTSSNLVLDRALHTPSNSLPLHKVPCY